MAVASAVPAMARGSLQAHALYEPSRLRVATEIVPPGRTGRMATGSGRFWTDRVEGCDNQNPIPDANGM